MDHISAFVTESHSFLEQQPQLQGVTYLEFSDEHIRNTADHSDEVEHVPSISEVVLEKRRHVTIRHRYELDGHTHMRSFHNGCIRFLLTFSTSISACECLSAT